MKKNNVQVTVTESFLELPEIQEIISKYKHTGFDVAVRMQLELLKCKHAIGRISHLRRSAHKIGVQLKTLLKIMDDCCGFVMDYQNDIYYMPRLRKKLHLPVEVSKDEINDIVSNGNVYFGYGEKDSGNFFVSKKDSQKFRKGFQNQATQNVDNQEEQDFTYKDKSKSVKDKNKDVKMINNASRCSDDAAAVNEFKKILSSHSWCRSVNKRHGINLEDNFTLGVLARWLYNYCCSNDKMEHSNSDLRQYANNLLRKGTRTRAEFDRYYDDCYNEFMSQSAETQNSSIVVQNYERIIEGIRHSSLGQVIPDAAPKQPSPYTAFSYIQDKWIPEDEYNAITETKAFDFKVTANPGYIKNWRGVA